jgi:hypothetical protein
VEEKRKGVGRWSGSWKEGKGDRVREWMKYQQGNTINNKRWSKVERAMWTSFRWFGGQKNIGNEP